MTGFAAKIKSLVPDPLRNGSTHGNIHVTLGILDQILSPDLLRGFLPLQAVAVRGRE